MNVRALFSTDVARMYVFAVADGLHYAWHPGVCIAPTRPFSREEQLSLQNAHKLATSLYDLTTSPMYKGLYLITPPVRVMVAGQGSTAILFGLLI